MDHDSSAGERVYLTVCPLCGLDHDSSVGERVYLTVCHHHGLSHDAQWVNECISLSILSVAWAMIGQWESE